MYIVDTHTHIYLPEFDDDRGEMMARAKAAGVDCMILPAIDASTHGAMMEVEKNYKGCLSMIGLHPCSVNGGFEKEIDIICSWLEQRKFAAIGETGLDFYCPPL